MSKATLRKKLNEFRKTLISLSEARASENHEDWWMAVPWRLVKNRALHLIVQILEAKGCLIDEDGRPIPLDGEEPQKAWDRLLSNLEESILQAMVALTVEI